VGSGFGTRERRTREILAASFSILNPRQRLIASEARPIDLGYAIANVIWTIAGSNTLREISFYNPVGERFSDDGVTLFGAPGFRIFRSAAGDQFELAAGKIERDPATRRAVIQVFNPLDLRGETRDCPCLVSLQFLLRGGVLHSIGHMRSQSALMVMPYDLFLLTMLHEAMAVRLGVALGCYHHFCGSLHYYDDEEELVDTVLREDGDAPPEMPPMTPLSPRVKAWIAEAEAAVRRSIEGGHPTALASRGGESDRYWAHLLDVMSAGALQRRGRTITEEDLGLLPPAYHRTLLSRNRPRPRRGGGPAAIRSREP
jgi:thymidylate synthase